MALTGSVEDYMINKVLTVKPEDSVLDALEIIVTGRDQLPVLNDKRELLGMITWREIAEHVILKDKKPEKVKVQEIMLKKTTTLLRTDTIKKALDIAVKERYALPVVEGKREKLTGLLSFQDILRRYLASMGA